MARSRTVECYHVAWIEGLDIDLSQLTDKEFLGQVERIADDGEVEIGPVIRSTMSGTYALSVDLLTDLGDFSYRSVFTVLVFDGTWILVESSHYGDEAIPKRPDCNTPNSSNHSLSTELQTVQPSKPGPDPIDDRSTLLTRRVKLETIPISVTVPADWIKDLDSDGQIVFINSDETILWGLGCIPGKDMRLYDVDDETVERIMTERVLIDFSDIGPIQIRRSNSFGFAAVSAETTIINGSDTIQTLTNFQRVANLNCTIGLYRFGISALTDAERSLADQLIDSIEPRP